MRIAQPPTQQKLKSLFIRSLKNIKNLEIDFMDSELTAIMGVNGCGKSTILHALACCYKPLSEDSGHNWKFSEFFTPNTDSRWQGSSFDMIHDYRIGNNFSSDAKMTFTKQQDRWAPKYDRRISRHVSFIGIETCVPVIEREKRQTFIRYNTVPVNNLNAAVIKEKCGVIMNRDYTSYNLHTFQKTQYIGVENDGCRYSALSMGAGEQRIFHIISEVFNAPKNSLILIDEIDLLLHVNALKKILPILKERAALKNLQIIFTTHSPVVLEMENIINIRHVYQTPIKTLCLDETKPDIMYHLTGENQRPLKIFVEDDLAKSIIKQTCTRLQMSKYVSIQQYGSAKNAFTLASGLLLQGENIDNYLFVLDGDLYKTEEEKRDKINKVLTGDTPHYEQLRETALEKITQFNLEEGYSPERYISKLIKELEGFEHDEIKSATLEIVNVDNNHKYVDDIIERLGEDRANGLRRIINLAAHSPKWGEYIQLIEDWLILKAPMVMEHQPQQVEIVEAPIVQ